MSEPKHCPLKGCEHIFPEVQEQSTELVAAGQRVAQIMGVPNAFYGDQWLYEECRRVEAEIRQHLETHTLEEWLVTVVALSEALDAQSRLVLDLQTRTCSRICCQGR